MPLQGTDIEQKKKFRLICLKTQVLKAIFKSQHASYQLVVITNRSSFRVDLVRQS